MSEKVFKKIIVFIPAVALLALLAGCSLSFNTGSGSDSGSQQAADAGVFKSADKGSAWEQKALIAGVGRQKSIANVDIISLAMDPQDNKAIYAGSDDNGLFFSYDAGASWQLAASLGKVSVTDVAVDPKNKCVVYAVVANKVFKSVDCSRSWSQVYFDNELDLEINDLAVNNNGNDIFIGTSRGEVIKSSDSGASWRTLDRFNSAVKKIVINPANPKVIFIGTNAKGIFRSTDGGEKWFSLDDNLKSFDNSQRFRDLTVIGGDKKTVFLATNYGLLKSVNDGDSWAKIELITPEKEAKINAIAVNPDNAAEIYYVTNTTFYRSLDGGQNWTSKKLPSSRAGWRILLDYQDANVVYLAAKRSK